MKLKLIIENGKEISVMINGSKSVTFMLPEINGVKKIETGEVELKHYPDVGVYLINN